MKKVKVVIADDSLVYRSQIRNAASSIPGVDVVGVASNGRVAIEFISAHKPDLLILDLEMPEMDGLQTLQEIKARGIQIQVLVFASVSKRGAEIALEALRNGANDFIAKPSGEERATTDIRLEPFEKIRQLLEPKIRALVFKQEHLGNVLLEKSGVEHTFERTIWESFRPQAVVIGSSTGGPTALESIFAKLRGQLNVPIFIAQHMPPIFTATLAERLSRISKLPVREGQDGELVQSGHVYIAPGDYHMVVAGDVQGPVIRLNKEPQVHSVRPAVDPLFISVSNIFKRRTLGVVLSGMGYDGRDGAIHIKKNGGANIIQSEASCVVFGMPGAVFSVGAYDKISDLNEVSELLVEKVFTNVPTILKAGA